MSANPILDNLERDAIREIQAENRWGLDMLAYHLHSDPITVRRWLHMSAPETDGQQDREDRLVGHVDRFLATYIHKAPLSHLPSRASHPTAPTGAKWLVTHCPHGHEYSPENTGYQPSGKRYCKTCRLERYGKA